MATNASVPNLVPNPSTTSAFEAFIEDRGASTENDEPSRMAPPPEAAEAVATPPVAPSPTPETEAEPQIPAPDSPETPEASETPEETPPLAASEDDPEITSLQGVAEAFGVEPEQFLEAIQIDVDGTSVSLASALDQVKNLPAEVSAYRAQSESFEDYDAKRTDLEAHYATATQTLMDQASTLAQVLQFTEPNWQKLADDGMDANTLIKAQADRNSSVQLVQQIMNGVQSDAAKMQSDAKESGATRHKSAVVSLRKMFPEWKSNDRFKADFAKINDFLTETMGYTQAAISRIENPSDYRLAFMAMVLDQAKTTGTTQFEKMKDGALAPTIRLTGHSRRDAPTAKANLRQSALAAHRKNGTMESAVALFEDYVPE